MWHTRSGTHPLSIQSVIPCPRNFTIMHPLRYVVGLLYFLFPFCLANPILNHERSEETSLVQNSISSQNATVDGWGDCVTCAAKCGLFFCTCSLACSPATPIEPWACYVRGFQSFCFWSRDAVVLLEKLLSSTSALPSRRSTLPCGGLG